MKKIIGVLIVSVMFLLYAPKVEAAKPTYTINPNSKTYNGNLMKLTTYNPKTKHYYVIRSYLERFEKTGGGTLILDKGTYTITNVLYVPSNVTIKLKNGAVLVKGTDTGTKKFVASKSMFQLIRPSYAEKKGKVGGYNGEKNISFIGEGTAKIDMKNMKDGIAIIAGHNQNLTISNIQFNNMNSGHFLEIDASKNVTIQNNKFSNSLASKEKIKEAINLDTPDRLTEGWSQIWSKFDKTPNDNVLIKSNSFYNLDVAIGTHNYSEGKYHNKVVIRNNTIDKMRTHGIRVMNWSNAIIENNVIKNVAGAGNRGILASGTQNPTFKNNQFDNLSRAIQFIVWKNDGKAASYKITYNKLSAQNKKDLETNSIKNGDEGHIRSNSVFNNYTSKTEEFSLKVISLKTKPKVYYASKPQAKAYKTTNKKGATYKTYATGQEIELYYRGNNWYYGFIKDSKGATVIAYFHEDEVQTTKPFTPEEVYANKANVKAYQSNSTSSKVLKTYPKGQKISLENLGNGWYFGYIDYNGKSTKVYISKNDLQKDKPFSPKVLYVSKGGANAYETMNKKGEVLGNHPIAYKLNIEYVSNNWYYGYINKSGKEVKVYYHEDEVQAAKPFTPEEVYANKDNVKAYESNSTSSKVLKTYPKAQKISLENLGNGWYFGYIDYNGKTTKVYISKNDLQKDKPFVPKVLYVSNGGANAYESMDKNGVVLDNHPIGSKLDIEYVGSDWYYGYINKNGKQVKVYYHEDEVQASKPYTPEQVYANKDIVNGYREMNTNSEVLRTYNKGTLISLENLNNGWYYGYIDVDSVRTKLYINENDLQKERP